MLVISIITTLFSIIIYNLRPADRISETNNTKRQTSINSVKDALEAYIVDNPTNSIALPSYNGNNISTECTNCAICKYDPLTTCPAGVDLDFLVPNYMSSLPSDPSNGSSTHTGYYIYQHSGRNDIGLVAPLAQNGESITVNAPIQASIPTGPGSQGPNSPQTATLGPAVNGGWMDTGGIFSVAGINSSNDYYSYYENYYSTPHVEDPRDNIFASAQLTNLDLATDYYFDNGIIAGDLVGGLDANALLVTNFGFTVPTSATINGIKVDIERKHVNPNIQKDTEIFIIKGGVAGTQNKADISTFYPTVDTYASYGGSTDLWGTTWNANEINASNFGVHFRPTPVWGQRTSVDNIRVTVYYTN